MRHERLEREAEEAAEKLAVTPGQMKTLKKAKTVKWRRPRWVAGTPRRRVPGSQRVKLLDRIRKIRQNKNV